MKQTFLSFLLMLMPMLASAELTHKFDYGYYEVVTPWGSARDYYISCKLINNCNANILVEKCTIYQNGEFLKIETISKDLVGGSSSEVEISNLSGISPYIFEWLLTISGKEFLYRCSYPEPVDPEPVIPVPVDPAPDSNTVEINGLYYILKESKTAEVTYKPIITFEDAIRDTGIYFGDIAIPEEVVYDGEEYSVTSISKNAFYKSIYLKSVTIPNSVMSIEDHAFYGCEGLTSVMIPNSVTSIEDYAFCSCSGLTSITIPKNVTSIGTNALSYCKALSSITIPNSVTKIGDYAFYCCFSLTTVTIPNSVTSIGYGCFSDCEALTSIMIPNSVTSIGGRAFFGCTNLTSITIPNNVTSIEEGTFGWCSSLTSITIPNSVKSFGEDIFYRCTGLTNFFSFIEEPFPISENVFQYLDEYRHLHILSPMLYVPEGTKEKYENTPGWNLLTNIVEMKGQNIHNAKASTPASNTPYYTFGGVRTNHPKKGFYLKDGKKLVVR